MLTYNQEERRTWFLYMASARWWDPNLAQGPEKKDCFSQLYITFAVTFEP